MTKDSIKIDITYPAWGLTLLFVLLKVTGTVDWSWLFVLSPLWGAVALVTAFVAVPVLLMVIVGVALLAVKVAGWVEMKVRRFLRPSPKLRK